MRMMYRYSYKFSNQDTALGKFLSLLLHVFSNVETTDEKENKKIKVAIVGAGNAGVNLANDLMNNEESSYVPRCFIDVNQDKVGPEINGIPVWSEDETTLKQLDIYEVQEIFFAIPSMPQKRKKELYNYYKNAGYKLKVYDYPVAYSPGNKRQLREFDIEEFVVSKTHRGHG